MWYNFIVKVNERIKRGYNNEFKFVSNNIN